MWWRSRRRWWRRRKRRWGAGEPFLFFYLRAKMIWLTTILSRLPPPRKGQLKVGRFGARLQNGNRGRGRSGSRANHHWRQVGRVTSGESLRLFFKFKPTVITDLAFFLRPPSTRCPRP